MTISIAPPNITDAGIKINNIIYKKIKCVLLISSPVLLPQNETADNCQLFTTSGNDFFPIANILKS